MKNKEIKTNIRLKIMNEPAIERGVWFTKTAAEEEVAAGTAEEELKSNFGCIICS